MGRGVEREEGPPGESWPLLAALGEEARGLFVGEEGKVDLGFSV